MNEHVKNLKKMTQSLKNELTWVVVKEIINDFIIYNEYLRR